MRLTVKFLRRAHPCFRICKLCAERGEWGWRATTAVSAPGAPVYRCQRFNQSVLLIFPRYSVATREMLPAAQSFITRYGPYPTRNDGGEAEVPHCREKSERVSGRMEIYKHPK
jgi:hypothetical protein